MPIWKYLHILSMVAAVTLLVGGDVMFHALRRTGDSSAIRRFLAAVNPLFGVGIALLTLGVIFGLITAATGSFDFTARWLLAAYVLVGLLYVVGLVVGLPYYRGVTQALGSGDEGAIQRALRSAKGWGSMTISVVGYATIIFLMVVKPSA